MNTAGCAENDTLEKERLQDPTPVEPLPLLGEVVEYFGFEYDVFGWSVGTRFESWGAKRLPRRHDGIATDTHRGKGVRSREAAVAWCLREAWERHIAKTVHARHPALYGPHRFSAEPVVEQLEPDYERVIWMGQEWRLHAPVPGVEKVWVSGALQPTTGIPAPQPRARQMHVMRRESLEAVLTPDIIRILGTAPQDVACVMCEPGVRIRYRQRKIRVGLAGRPEVNEVACLAHIFRFFVHSEEENLLHDLGEGWWLGRDELWDWVYEDAEAAEDGREVPGVRRRWLAHLADARNATAAKADGAAADSSASPL
ncbi:hypothetical protein ACX9I7_00665 [Streptomyces sp. L500]